MLAEGFVADARDVVERRHVVEAEILGGLHAVPDRGLVDGHIKVGPAHTELDSRHGRSFPADQVWNDRSASISILASGPRAGKERAPRCGPGYGIANADRPD